MKIPTFPVLKIYESGKMEMKYLSEKDRDNLFREFEYIRYREERAIENFIKRTKIAEFRRLKKVKK